MRLRPFVHRAASAAGLSRLARHAFRARPLVVCYHGVCNSAPDVPDLEGLQVPRELFEEQMRFLLRHYQPVSLQQVRDHLADGSEIPARAVLVTFDDGYRNVVHNALPFLRRLGVPCTIFLVVGLVGSQRSIWTAELEWWRRRDPDLRQLKRRLKAASQSMRKDALRTLLPDDSRLPTCDSSLLTWDEARPWVGPDVAFGSHGLTHEALTTCDDASLERELELSRHRIQAELSIPSDALAYPNGDHSPRIVEAAVRCGYSLAFTTVSRHLGVDDTRFTVPRILVGREDRGFVLASRLSGWAEWTKRGQLGLGTRTAAEG